jgi:hypothetical protein
MPMCEGCGSRADDSHIRRRAERLELSQKFRPALVRVLFIDAAPPARIEDFFYNPQKDRSVRSVAARMFFDEMARTTRNSLATDWNESSVLQDFQRSGFFLMYAVECAFEDQGDPQNSLRRLAPTVLKRVQNIYNPSYIVPLSQPTQELIRLFGLIGWGERFLLHQGGPFVDPYLGNPKKQAEMGTGYGERIKKALAVLP